MTEVLERVQEAGSGEKKLSMKEMCEAVAESQTLSKKDGTSPTADEIFNYSSTGELYMIFVWYDAIMEIAKRIREDFDTALAEEKKNIEVISREVK